MSVKKIGEKYYCTVCGNEVTVTKVGGPPEARQGGTLVCCGKTMEIRV